MKYLLSVALIVPNFLLAEDINIIPYTALVQYDKNENKSLKDTAQFGGLYLSLGNSGYLLEAAYSYLSVTYKNATIYEDVTQEDIYLKYSSYYENSSYKIGLHIINNSEKENVRDLGSGFVGIIGLDAYHDLNKDKIIYGFDAYYSVYMNAYTDTNTTQTTVVDVMQVSPHLTFIKNLDKERSNTLTLRANLIAATQYKDRGYTSYEVEDTLYYYQIVTTLRYMWGDMKSSVTDGGMSVYNNKDLMHESYDLKVGYILSENFVVDAKFSLNYYQEYDARNLILLTEGYNTNTLLSLSLNF